MRMRERRPLFDDNVIDITSNIDPIDSIQSKLLLPSSSLEMNLVPTRSRIGSVSLACQHSTLISNDYFDADIPQLQERRRSLLEVCAKSKIPFRINSNQSVCTHTCT